MDRYRSPLLHLSLTLGVFYSLIQISDAGAAGTGMCAVTKGRVTVKMPNCWNTHIVDGRICKGMCMSTARALPNTAAPSSLLYKMAMVDCCLPVRGKAVKTIVSVLCRYIDGDRVTAILKKMPVFMPTACSCSRCFVG